MYHNLRQQILVLGGPEGSKISISIRDCLTMKCIISHLSSFYLYKSKKLGQNLVQGAKICPKRPKVGNLHGCIFSKKNWNCGSFCTQFSFFGTIFQHNELISLDIHLICAPCPPRQPWPPWQYSSLQPSAAQYTPVHPSTAQYSPAESNTAQDGPV